jgi:hypothetical protein
MVGASSELGKGAGLGKGIDAMDVVRHYADPDSVRMCDIAVGPKLGWLGCRAIGRRALNPIKRTMIV